MTDPLVQRRRKAIDSAKASNALSGFEPSDFGLSVFERWVSSECNAQQAVDAVISGRAPVSEPKSSRRSST